MAVSEAAAGFLGFIQSQIDRVVPPESRQWAYTQTSDLASARPLLFAFLVSLVTFSLIPVLLFLSFTGSAVLLAGGAALVFTMFWTGVALAVLVPTLFITCGIAICVWAWAVASFMAARWAFRVVQSIAGSPDGSAPSSSAFPSPLSWTKVPSDDDDDETKHADEKTGPSLAHKPGFGYESVLGT
ncbi:hypothetical protein MFIFM68171_04986 [Madurella fahalii]|uniref:Uncharacterized protein n=1 Tax=Madurella fahalii TaxID=1157608 RepID=A0ABQ0GAH8_9PEZI